MRLLHHVSKYLQDVANEIECSVEDVNSGNADLIAPGFSELHASGLYIQSLNLLAGKPAATPTGARLSRNCCAEHQVLDAEIPLTHQRLKFTMLCEAMTDICFDLSRTYQMAKTHYCPPDYSLEDAVDDVLFMQLPEPLQSILVLNQMYNRSCLLDLPFPGLTDRPNLAVWLFDDRATKWRASLQALAQKLRPSFSAILFLHGRKATLMLDDGFCELFHKGDKCLDLLVLHILCLEHGGVEALIRRTNRSGGLHDFIDAFQDIRCSVLTSYRDMFITRIMYLREHYVFL